MQESNYIQINRLEKIVKDASKLVMVNHKDEYKIIFVQQGQLHLRIGDKSHMVQPKSLIFVAPGQSLQLFDSTKYVEGLQLVFDTDYFLLCLKNQVKLCFYPFFQLHTTPFLKLSDMQWSKLFSLVERINFEVVNRVSINDDLLCRLYLNVLLIDIERLHNLKTVDEHNSLSRKQLITSRFKTLVEKNFIEMRKVAAYADKLFISPTYLNDTVKSITGFSASEMIHQRVILEIKAKLIQTEDTISQIAFDMEYNDTSYFCRFFKKNTGITPQMFRKTNHFQ